METHVYPKSVKIAKRKSDNLHYIIRVCPPADLDECPAYGKESFAKAVKLLNDLLVAKTHKQLMQAISKMPPIVPTRSFGGVQRRYSHADFTSEKFSRQFIPADISQLEAEFFLDSSSEIRANVSGIKSLLDEYDSRVEWFGKTYEGKSDTVVLVEPVLDWATLHNSLTLCARLLGRLRDAEGADDVLQLCGFRRRYNNYYQCSMWSIPFKYCCVDDVNKKNLNWLTGKGVKGSDPLFFALSTWATWPARQPYLWWIPGVNKTQVEQFDTESDVFFAHKTTAMEEYRKVFGPNNLTAQDKITFLCVKDTGSQKNMAADVVRSFVGAYRRLVDSGAFADEDNFRILGWTAEDVADKELYGEPDHPETLCLSWASLLMYVLVYHPSKRFTVCDYCGNAVLSNTRGTRKEYCSDSCRVRGANRRKLEALEGAFDD